MRLIVKMKDERTGSYRNKKGRMKMTENGKVLITHVHATTNHVGRKNHSFFASEWYDIDC